MKKALFCMLSVVLILLSGCNSQQKNKVSKPNIIVILLDDAGYADFGFMGSKDLETPRIDELAQKSTIFSDAHVTATVCAPSRAGLITGRYQQRFGSECNGTGVDMGVDPEETSLADAMKSAGYKTIAIGKWHLGHTEEYLPNNRGFDEFYGFLGGSRSYFPLENPGPEQTLMDNTLAVEFSGYLTDVFGDKAVEYIEKYRDEPFFMYLAFNAVHTPMDAKQEHLEKYREHPRSKLAAMTWSLDENIGKVLDKINQEGLNQNTMIWFLSDNGGANNNQSSNGQLKGWKGNKFEGGHRVPFMVSWPGQIKENALFDGLSSSLDIFATSIAAAGIENYEGKALDGVDLLPYLRGEKDGDPHQSLYWRKDEAAAVRKNDFKIIRLKDYGYTMYNLASDPFEATDLSAKNTGVFEELKTDLEGWEENLISPLWVEEEEWTAITHEIHEALMENRTPLYSTPSQYFKYLDSRNTK